MRTMLLLSVAASAVIWADSADAAQDKAAEAAAAAREAVAAAGASPAPVATPAPAPAPVAPTAPAHGVTYDSEARVETRTIAPAPVIRAERRTISGAAPIESEYRTTGHGDARGEWLCTQDGPDAREYRCRFDGDQLGPRPAPGGWQDMAWSDAEWAEEEALRRDLERACKPDNGVGGSLIGGLLGGFAGNRIFGRGNRTAGTLIGGALGAIAGGVIDQAEDKSKCRDAVRRVEERQRGWHGGGGYWQSGHTSYGHGPGWYSPGVIVTTVTSAPVVTETVTTETFYESVPVRKRHVSKKRYYKPKPKPRCVC